MGTCAVEQLLPGGRELLAAPACQRFSLWDFCGDSALILSVTELQDHRQHNVYAAIIVHATQ